MIVLDASVLIAHLAGDDAHAALALQILDTEEELAIHPVTLAECLVGPARLNRELEAMAMIKRLGIEQVAISHVEPMDVARLRAATQLKLPDCFVLAAAMHAAASLATFDASLSRAAAELGITVAV